MMARNSLCLMWQHGFGKWFVVIKYASTELKPCHRDKGTWQYVLQWITSRRAIYKTEQSDIRCSYSPHCFSSQNIFLEVYFESLRATSRVFSSFPGCDLIVYSITIPQCPPEVQLHLFTLEGEAFQHRLSEEKNVAATQEANSLE